MQHVITQISEPFRAMNGALEVHQVPSAHDNLVWVIVCLKTGTCGIVDGPEAGSALDYCAARGLTPTVVLNTHTHGDHIGVNMDLARRGLLDGMRVVGAARTAEAIPGLTEPVRDGDVISFGAVEATVLETDGHLDGHISFVFGDVLFCGDTLFGAGCGYLFDGPPAKMFESLMRLAALPPETRVCCAHEYTEDNLRFAWSVEPDNAALAERIQAAWSTRAEGRSTVPSTVAVERATNPFLRPGSVTLRETVASALPDRAMESFAEVFAATRALKDSKAYRKLGDESLPLA